jgi:addiction module HigA family antidote
MHNPPHPGLVLREYLTGISVSAAAAQLCTTRTTLCRVLDGKAGISANLALRLADALGSSPDLWMNMQSQYDLWHGNNGETLS